MRYYLYDDQEGRHRVSTNEIFEMHWPTWYTKMVKKYGAENPRVNWEDCLKDWVTLHWAWEERPTEK